MPKAIELNVNKDSFQRILSNKKDFEVRLNHYEIKEGDTLKNKRFALLEQRRNR